MAFRELLGIEIKERDGGRAKLLFRAGEEHLNDGGIVDDGEQPVTVEAKVNYLEPGELGTLVADARVRRKGKRFTVLEAEVTQKETGEHVAYATATFTILQT
jgi:acyl-coenzyme A thioesterase PaaI-like protein